MATVLVERSFEQPVDLAEFSRLAKRFGWCLEANGVKFLHTYVSADGKRTVCVYEAPDAEAVRRVSDQARMPYERIWSATIHRPG